MSSLSPEPTPVQAAQVDANEDAISILIVDDEPANLLVLETLLDDPGYRIVRAESAEQALLALVEQEFALLILDVRMPVMNGFELAQMIKERKRTASVPIIFLTAYYDKDQHAMEGYGSGAGDFLSKPVQPHVLRSKVAVFADLHRKNRAVVQTNKALLKEIAERRRAEQELRELNETLERRVEERSSALLQADRRLQTLMNSITDGLLMLDSAWCFTFVNEEGARLLGKSSDALLGTSIWRLFPGIEKTKLWTGLREAVTRSTAESFEVHYPGPQEQERWLQCHCYPSAEGVSVYFHDISDRHELEALQQELLSAEQAARGESERIARAKDEFLASLSHELRTPLAAIIGWTRIVSRPDTDEETVRRGLEAIGRNAQVQSQLVADLLDMGRIVSGKLRINTQAVDLRSVAVHAVEAARPTAQAKNLSIDLQVPEDGQLTMRGDPARLQQVVSNLVSNALKFTPEGGRVAISAAGDEEEVRLVVLDTGQGIEPAFLPHLFERFSQADGSASREHGGLGLGLAIAKSIVEAHGGWIDVHSAGRGQGAAFTIHFPRAATAIDDAADGANDDGSLQLVREPDSAPHACELALQGVTVLAVDDHPDVLELHRRALNEFGAAVTAVSSAEEALEQLRSTRFDVLLSDLGMRGTDGFALIRTIRSTLGMLAEDLPAAAVTAFTRQVDQERALAAGYQMCIAKPVYSTALVGAVIQLKRRQSRRTPPPQSVAGKASLRVLYVEDNADVMRLTSMMLQDEGLTVAECGNADDAEVMYRRDAFDFILTDVRLAGTSGVELARRVLRANPSARVIFCSGYSTEHWLADFGPTVKALPKPFTPEELWKVLTDLNVTRGEQPER